MIQKETKLNKSSYEIFEEEKPKYFNISTVYWYVLEWIV